MARRAPFPQSRLPASIEKFNKAKCMYVWQALAGPGGRPQEAYTKHA